MRASEAELKQRLRASHLETPGSSEASFAALWPELLRAHQLQQTLSTPDLATEYAAFRRSQVLGRPD